MKRNVVFLAVVLVVVLGILWFLWTVYQIQAMGGWDAYMEQSRAMMEQWGIEE